MRAFFVGVFFCVVVGCRGAVVEPRVVVDGSGEVAFSAAAEDAAVGVAASADDAIDVEFDGRLRLRRMRLPRSARAGESVDVVFAWLVERDLAGRVPRVFVHARVDGAEINAAQADHDLPRAGELRPGDVVIDRFTLTLPAEVAGDVTVRAGVYERIDDNKGAKKDGPRWRAVAGANVTRDLNDDAVWLAHLSVAGAAPPAVVDVMHTSGPIVVDGVFDEGDWARAAPMPLVHYLGKADARLLPTTAKMLWSDDALYLAFTGTDPDPFSPYTKRDDPLYDSEAYEIFIDADGDGDSSDGEYVELQSNAFDLHFDSAFHGGRRKGMEVAFNHPFETKTVIQHGEVHQEWKIPVAGLRGIPVGEPRAGAVWKANLFRLERRRRGEKIVANEASAWSPPLSNDFHNLARLGTLRFQR